jgi:hypothetical protein
MNFPHLSQLQPQKSHISARFGKCGTRSGHIHATSFERQLKYDGQLSQYNNGEIPCLCIQQWGQSKKGKDFEETSWLTLVQRATLW